MNTPGRRASPHRLDVIALLRRWPGSSVRDAFSILFWNTALAWLLTAAILVGEALLRGRSGLDTLVRVSELAPLLPFAALSALVMIAVLRARQQRTASAALAARQSAQIAHAAQLLAETRLRTVQAQIAPHFLYNTLANVVGLIETEPARARHLLERFSDYLRGTLAASRADQSSVGAEAELARAYLDVLSVRMGARLRYWIEIADDCRDLPVAPMLLQPLLENAVAHGLEPRIEGGEIVLRAMRQGGQLRIEVNDTGAGLSGACAAPADGASLSQLRARLRSIHAGAAEIQLLENQPRGISARLLLPVTAIPPSTGRAP